MLRFSKLLLQQVIRKHCVFFFFFFFFFLGFPVTSSDDLVEQAVAGGRFLAAQSEEARSAVLLKLADLLELRVADIVAANDLDMRNAHATKIAPALLARLF
jgi:hypothetical protein